MKKQPQHLLTATIVILIVITTFFPANLVSGQSVPPIYFPLFSKNKDPYYAFGLDGGTVENVIVDPSDSNIIYAGTWGNGIYKSLDGGESWEIHVTDELRSAYIYEIAIDPLNSNHLLASVYEHGLDQSFDGGITWEPTEGFDGYYVAYSIDFDSSVALSDPVRSSTVYTAIREQTYYSSTGFVYPGGVWKSTDGGDSWAQITFSWNGFKDEDYIYDLAIDPRDPQIIYTANHRTGVYRTLDGGITWTKKSSGLVHQDIRGIQVNPVTGRIYAGIWDGYGFAYSDNYGESWKNNSYTDGLDLYVYEVQYDPNQPEDVYLTTSTGVYLCESPSESSTCSVMANEGKFVFDLALDLNGPTAYNNRVQNMYTGLQHLGLHKSDDGGMKFDPSYEGIRANIIRAVAINEVDPDIQFVSASYRGLYRTTDGGVSWMPLHYSLIQYYINEIVFIPGTLDTLLVGDKYGGFHFSTDNGDTWITANAGLSRSAEEEIVESEITGSEGWIDEEDYAWMDPVDLQDLMDATGSEPVDRGTSLSIKTISIDPDNSDFMFAGRETGGVVYSNNGGLSWSKSNLTSGNIQDSMVDPSQPDRYIIGQDDYGVKRSSDRINWGTLNTGFPSGTSVYALALQGPGIFLAGTEYGVYRIDLNGIAAWIDLGLGLIVRDVAVDPLYSDMIWAATDSGLFYGVPAAPGEPYNWTEFDVPESNNPHFTVIKVIPGATREFFVGMDGGDLVKLTEDILPSY